LGISCAGDFHGVTGGSHCGFTSHADLNAAFNILRRAKETLLSCQPNGWWGSGAMSTAPEAQTAKTVMGKPSA
jgi:transposase